jgi:hypothetical protein
MFTPVYESVHVLMTEGIPSSLGVPPRHPDIYNQLCRRLGQNPLDHDAPVRIPLPRRPRP